MGAGQIGGIATLLDLDFKNAAGFLGEKAELHEAQYVVHYLSHAMIFCMGSLLEAHIILTPASCVYGERHKFQVFGGTHKFVEFAGISRWVNNMAMHRGYNHSLRWEQCKSENLALLVVDKQFYFNKPENGAEFMVNRIRYGVKHEAHNCKFYGWGSRRNGYLVPLLIHLYRLDVTVIDGKECESMWDNGGRYLCIYHPPCKDEKYGALCPTDMGSILDCSGFATGMMISRLIDRPCAVGFVDLRRHSKFLTCGVDDSRDVIDHADMMMFEATAPPSTSQVMSVESNDTETED